MSVILIPTEDQGISAIGTDLTLVTRVKSRNLQTNQIIGLFRIRTQDPAFTIIHGKGSLRNAADREQCLLQ